MTIDQSTLVSDIARSVPSSVRVFQRHGVDFCCGGKKSLARACEELGLSADVVAREIETSAEQRVEDRDWLSASLAELTEFIVARYHQPLRQEMPRLEAMSRKALRAHSAKAPELLARIESIVGELSGELGVHMLKEEAVLFPAIRRLEDTGATSLALAEPIATMESEHDHAGELLAELRQITGGYAVPEWACPTVRALYAGLAELESEMHVHVHLENNVLFPLALSLLEGAPDDVA